MPQLLRGMTCGDLLLFQFSQDPDDSEGTLCCCRSSMLGSNLPRSLSGFEFSKIPTARPRTTFFGCKEIIHNFASDLRKTDTVWASCLDLMQFLRVTNCETQSTGNDKLGQSPHEESSQGEKHFFRLCLEERGATLSVVRL